MSKPAKLCTEHVEMMNSDQVAARFQMTRESLYKAISRGLVPRGTRIPGLGLRWRADEIDEWVAQKLPKRNPFV